MARHELRPGLHSTSPGLPLVGPLRPRKSHRRPERSPFPRPLPCPTTSAAVRPGSPLSAHRNPTPPVSTYSPLVIAPRRRRIPRIDWSAVICSLITVLVIGVPLVVLLFGDRTQVSACWGEDGSRAHAVDGPWC
jgi:hypothetical protein